MVSFSITPRGKGYWIEKTDHDGSRTVIERVATEDEALRRLKALQQRAAMIERKSATLPRF